ncbi:hypothetical protein J6TS7_37030 [Paenibacillus dendritiformis]|nr:hypothetical protein J6TS7_37030 [Paenibacillus dendritiformis]
MVRYSPNTWMKSSVEYIPDSPNKLGAVVTNHGYSDWSTQEADDGDAPLYFRISRIGSDFYAFAEVFLRVVLIPSDLSDFLTILQGLGRGEGGPAIFLDISGSMSGEYLRIGSVFALALYKQTQGSSLFWLFDTRVTDAKPSRKDCILSRQSAFVPAEGPTPARRCANCFASRKRPIGSS